MDANLQPPSAGPRDLTTALAGRYVIERELGSGGMATVYLAHDVRHGRQVAIKVLHPNLAATLGSDRFLAEIQTTARLLHPHILPLLDSGQTDDAERHGRGLLYYVMPYVAGESLRTRLEREKQLPVADALRIASHVADALGHAHGHGIVHRDIKPENILLQGEHALVADFGIALAVEQAGGARLTQAGVSLGTPQYMAPEQAMGERTITARSDVYALGVVTYEMLVGEPPFSGPTAQAIIAKVVTEEPKALTLHRRNVPPHVDAAVRTALEKLPADRFPSAAAFAAALADPGAGRSVAVAPATTERSGVRGLAPRGAATLAVGALATGLALGWAVRGTPPTRREPVRFTIEPESGYLRVGPPAISPDGRTIIYAVDGPGVTRLYLRRVGEIASRPLAGTEDGEWPFFSPDGSWVAFHSNGIIKKTRLDGGATIAVTTLSRPQFQGGSWGYDDVIFYVVWPQGDLYRVPSSGGAAVRVMAGDSTGRIVSVHGLPGGRAVVVTVTPDGVTGRIGLLDLASGRLRQLGPGAGARFGGGHLVYAGSGGQLYRLPFDAQRLEPTGGAQEIADHLGSDDDPSTSFDVSRSGTLIYHISYGHTRRLSLVDRAGREVQGVDGRGIWAPRFAPDGRRVAYGAYAPGYGRADLWITDLAAGTTQRVTADTNDNNDPQWSPDGKSITYSAIDGTGHKDLFVRATDGAKARLLLTRPGWQFPTDWSRDGRALLFTNVTPAGDQSIWVQPMNGGVARPYVDTPFREVAARLSPDGRWVAYSSNETGRGEVYVQSYPMPGRKTLVSAEGGGDPAWRADGRELYYWRANQLVAASLEAGALGEPPVVRARAPLFRAAYVPAVQANYDASADGTRFIVVTGGRLANRIVVGLHVVDTERATSADRR